MSIETQLNKMNKNEIKMQRNNIKITSISNNYMPIK